MPKLNRYVIEYTTDTDKKVKKIITGETAADAATRYGKRVVFGKPLFNNFGISSVADQTIVRVVQAAGRAFEAHVRPVLDLKSEGK